MSLRAQKYVQEENIFEEELEAGAAAAPPPHAHAKNGNIPMGNRPSSAPDVKRPRDNPDDGRLSSASCYSDGSAESYRAYQRRRAHALESRSKDRQSSDAGAGASSDWSPEFKNLSIHGDEDKPVTDRFHKKSTQ